MATTAIVVRANGSTSYTVPANKRLVCKAFPYGNASGVLMLNSVNLANPGDGIGPTLGIGPVVANAGDVFTGSNSTGWTLNGFLFDV